MTSSEEKYRARLHILSCRCEAIQKDNEKLARQVISTKRKISKARRLRLKLIMKLDKIGDDWRDHIDDEFPDNNEQPAPSTSSSISLSNGTAKKNSDSMIFDVELSNHNLYQRPYEDG